MSSSGAQVLLIELERKASTDFEKELCLVIQHLIGAIKEAETKIPPLEQGVSELYDLVDALE